MSGHSRTKPHERNLGGRPLAIDDATLLNNRDCWIGFLSNAWGDIGFRLWCARIPTDIRETFALITGVAAHEKVLLVPFVRETTISAGAREIRRTQDALKGLREREYECCYSGDRSMREMLSDRVRDSKEALRVAWAAHHKDRTRFREEHVRRVTELVEFTKELEAIQRERATLETVLADQEASFAQRELVAFIRKRKYAHSPRRLARAMAGLPRLGAWQSFRRCGEHPESPLWPPFRFRLFAIIAKAWQQRSNRSKRAFLDRLEKQVHAIRTKDRKGHPDHHAIGVQRYLFENWWHLNKAVDATDIARAVPASVPYLVFSDFVKQVAQGTSTTDRVLASMEQLIDRPKRQKGKRR